MPPDAPPTDALGFAETRIVIPRMSTRGAVVRFYRVWMKPGNLTFPKQYRRLEGEEHDQALLGWLRSRRSMRGRELRLDAGPPPAGGVCPKKDFAPPGEVGDSAANQPPPNFFAQLPAIGPGDWPEGTHDDALPTDPTPTEAGVCPENAESLAGVP